MKALIIGKKDRYEKFLPDMFFAKSTEKIYLDMGTSEEVIIEKGKDADFLAADAIASISGNVIANLPSLKIIHSEGVAYNGIDCKAAAKRNIFVCNNRGINAAAVAEQTIYLMLGLLRSAIEGNTAVLEGRQIQMKEQKMIQGITELGDCNVGLLGFGDIAKATAVRLKAFGCKVYYHATTRKPPEIEDACGAVWMEPSEMVKICNFISIHVPVTPETIGMIDEAFLKSMRPDAWLINTARGEIVDNEALCKALREGWIAGAGLDTVSPEPVQKDNPLVCLPEEIRQKILFSPHLGGITTSTFHRAHSNIWNAFEAVSKGERPKNIVNGI